MNAKVEEVAQVFALSGSVDAPQRASLRAAVAANIHKWSVQEGESVQAGQILGTLDDADLKQRVQQAEHQALAAQAQTQTALRQLESNRALVGQGFISPLALKASEDAWLSAQSNLMAAQAATRIALKALEDATVRAPFDGLVSRVWVKTGDRVAVNAPLVDLVNLQSLEVVATVPADQLADIKIGQRARLQLEGVAEQIVAPVARINPSLNPSNRSATLYLRLPQGVAARPGAFAQGSLETGRVRGVAVPSTAIRTEKPEPYLQVLKDGRVQHIPARELTEGVVDGENYTVVKDLQPGLTILGVTAGIMAAGTQVRVIAAPAAAQ